MYQLDYGDHCTIILRQIWKKTRPSREASLALEPHTIDVKKPMPSCVFL